MQRSFLYWAVTAILRSSVLLTSTMSWTQSKPEATPPPGRPKQISIQDVCAAALPRATQGKHLEWSPDGRTIAYFQPVDDRYGLKIELGTVGADGNGRRVLLSSTAINQLFPATPTGHQGRPVSPPIEAVGFQWSPDETGLLLYNNLRIYWLELATLKTRPLVLGDEPLSDIQLSPDGRSAAFVRSHNLWVVDTSAVSTSGVPARAVTRDGTEILRKGELDWLYPARLGTKHGYAWSPDSSRIAYLEFNLKGVATYTPPFRLEEDPLLPTIDYPKPGSKNPQVRVFLVAVNGKSSPVAVDTGKEEDAYLPRLQWLPDGKHLAVQLLDRAQSRLDLLLADPSTGATRLLLTDKDQYWINLSDILYFLKGKPQLIWSSERSGYRQLYLYGLDGKLVRQLTDGKWEVTSLNAVDEQKQAIYYTSTQESPLERQLYTTGLGGQPAKRITSFSGTHEASFAPDASEFVDNFSTAIKPWVRTVYKLEEPANPHPATKVFALDPAPAAPGTKPAFATVNFINVTTHDSMQLNAMLIQSAGFSPTAKHPAVVFVRGGPGEQAVHDSWDGDISLWEQFLAQHGYVVFAVDNRGTAGRGHLFEEYLHYRFAGQEMPDQQDALQFLRSLPYVDPARIGIWGRGFGGGLTVNAMLHPRMGLKAGFAVAPIVDWLNFDSAFTERYLGSSVSNLAGYLASSPLDKADNLKNPLLVAQGTADLEVHPDQAMELQHELVEAQKYAEISLYSAQGHTIDGPDACVVSYQRATDFFAQSLLATGSDSPTGDHPETGGSKR